jgi:hypothetical protein
MEGGDGAEVARHVGLKLHGGGRGGAAAIAACEFVEFRDFVCFVPLAAAEACIPVRDGFSRVPLTPGPKLYFWRRLPQ